MNGSLSPKGTECNTKLQHRVSLCHSGGAERLPLRFTAMWLCPRNAWNVIFYHRESLIWENYIITLEI